MTALSPTAIDQFLDCIDDIRHRARLCAAVNPLGFLVTTGMTLPGYLSRLDDLEATFREIKRRAAA